MSHGSSNIDVLVIAGSDVRGLLTMAQCIELIDQTMRTVSRGSAQLPLRIGAAIPGGNILATMPGYLPGFDDGAASTGAKVIAVYPDNAKRGSSSHTGVVVLFDPSRGVPVAIIDATSITGLRTAAASAVATRALARPEASRLAILGTGEQAAAHLISMNEVKRLRSVRVWGRTLGRATEFAQREGVHLDIPIHVAVSVEEAVHDADIICTTTSSREPILDGEWVRPGTHVNLVGASAASAREVNDALVMQSSFFFDFRASVMAQAGELLSAAGSPALIDSLGNLRGEIGEVLDGRIAGRTSSDEITIYKSLGIAAQDLAVAQFVYERALRTGRGTRAAL